MATQLEVKSVDASAPVCVTVSILALDEVRYAALLFEKNPNEPDGKYPVATIE